MGPHAFTKHYELDGFKELEEKLDAGEKIGAPKRLKFRDEEDFVLLNIRWGNTISIPTDLGEKIKGFQSLGTLFYSQISTTLIVIWLLALVLKDTLETPNYEILNYRENVGLSLNLESLATA